MFTVLDRLLPCQPEVLFHPPQLLLGLRALVVGRSGDLGFFVCVLLY